MRFGDRPAEARDRRYSRREVVLGGVAGTGLLLGGGLLAGCGGDDSGAREGAPVTTGQPRKGGVLRVGVGGGTTSDSLDPHFAFYTFADSSRLNTLYDQLVRSERAGVAELQLAESLEPNAAGDEWTVRIPAGVEFHNGKTIDADDVIFSLRRAADPKSSVSGGMSYLDTKRLRKLDARTVRIGLTEPVFILQDLLGVMGATFIVPVDFDPENPVGSGSFRLKEFTPGEQATVARFDNYWDGVANLDEVVTVDLTDTTARMNAFLSSQVDAIEGVPAGQISALEQSGGSVFVSKASEIVPLVMRTDRAPFDDERVRRAFKLIANREQMVQQVFSGRARVANDVYSPFDPCYDDSLAQREQDIDEARSLLAQAGRSDVAVELSATTRRTGQLEMCQTFAQQAKEAGVAVKVTNVEPTAWAEGWMQWPFTVIYLTVGGGSFPALSALISTKDAPWNDTHWDDPEFNDLYAQALSEPDDGRRCEINAEMQRIYHDRGGWIIWSFRDFVDGVGEKVKGMKPAAMPLGAFNWKDLWLA
jgi:peptide/nickel transport system substrate-binding protein